VYVDFSTIADGLRVSLAFFNFIVVCWSIVWFLAFWRSYRQRKENGPTVALMIKFTATAIFHAYLLFGFLYLVSPCVTPGRSVALLIWGNLGVIGIIIAYIGLQWRFGRDE